MNDYVIKNHSGKRIALTKRSPENQSKGVAIVLHGLGGWKEQPVIVEAAERLCKNGYIAVTFDAANGANGPDADFFNGTNSDYLLDVEDVVAFLRSEGWLSTGQEFVLAGHSQGGLVALFYASRHPSDVRRLILLAPAISWKATLWPYGIGMAVWATVWILTGSTLWIGPTGRQFKISRKWLFDFFKFDGFKAVKNITADTLIISAEKDMTVATPREHEKFAKHFSKIRHVTIPHAPHTFLEHEKEVGDTIDQWLTSS